MIVSCQPSRWSTTCRLPVTPCSSHLELPPASISPAFRGHVMTLWQGAHVTGNCNFLNKWATWLWYRCKQEGVARCILFVAQPCDVGSTVILSCFSQVDAYLSESCPPTALRDADLIIHRAIRTECWDFNTLSYTITWNRRICLFFLFNRKTLQVFVSYLTDALCVHALWFYKHQHDNRVRSQLSAYYNISIINP
jgi:hypothetical protein